MTYNFKVGIGVNAKTGEKDWSNIRAFGKDHWDSIRLRNRSGWEPFPKVPVFISFNEYNRPFMEYLAKELEESPLLRPVVVEANRKGGKELAHLVMTQIQESEYFIPILSEESMKTQFINQEIGYAKAMKSLSIIPIVERKMIVLLKGFIHNQLQLPYLFNVDEEDPRRPAHPDMIELVMTLLEDLHIEVAQKYNVIPVITPQ